MRSKIKNERIPYKLLTLAILSAAVFFVCKIVYAGIIALPYPKELLEPSNIMLTNQFAEGNNPYELSILSREIPGVNYDYAFIGSLIAAAIVKITGCSAVTAHFAISLISILASAVIGFAIVQKQTKTTVAPCFAALLFMFCHWRFGYISAAPDDLGLLFYVLTLYFATSQKIKHKPIVCALGITLCFYTKQYFVLVAVPVFIYMLLYSRIEALKLFAWTVGINAAVAVAITIWWPLYWTKAFLFTYMGTVVGGGGAFSTVLEQLKYLGVLFAALFAVLIVFAVVSLVKLFQSNTRLRNIRISENDAFILHAVTTVIMIIPLCILGRNDGAFLSYFLQLWMPSIAVVTAMGIERIDHYGHERIYICLYFALVIFTVYFGFHKLPLHIMTDEERENWNRAYEYIEEYSRSGDVFYSRSLSYDGFVRGNGEWICDHDAEVSKHTVDSLITAGVPDELIEHSQLLVAQNLRYRKYITDKAESHGYSLITFELKPKQQLFTEEYCDKIGYTCIDVLELQLGNNPYKVAFYVP